MNAAPTPARAAAEALWAAWTAGELIDAIPAAVRPPTPQLGAAAQRELVALGGPTAGWKIAATSAAGQRHIGVDGPIAGRLLERFRAGSGESVTVTRLHMAVAEAEFGFRMATELAPAKHRPLAREEVLAAVDSAVLAIELPESRFVDFAQVGKPQLIADDACAGRFVIGPDVPDWRRHDLREARTAIRVDGALAAEGIGANVLGDPVEALVWLANDPLRSEPIRAGEVIISGTTTVPPAIVAGSSVEADFGALGGLSVEIASPPRQ